MTQPTIVLPEPYTARPEPKKGAVAVGRPGFVNVSVPEDAIDAVARALGTLTPDGQRLDAVAVLRISDPFTERSVDVPASYLGAVGAVIAQLAVKKAGHAAPAKPAEKAPASAAGPGKARKKGKPVPTVAEAVPAPAVQEDPGREAAAAPSEPSAAVADGKRKRRPKARKRKAKKPARVIGALPAVSRVRDENGLPPKPPGYDQAVEEVNAGYPDIRVWAEPTPLAMKSAVERTVMGRASGGEKAIRWGFEVFGPGREHLAWVIALGERKFLISGLKGEAPEEAHRRPSQRHMAGILARIDVSL